MRYFTQLAIGGVGFRSLTDPRGQRISSPFVLHIGTLHRRGTILDKVFGLGMRDAGLLLFMAARLELFKVQRVWTW